MQRPMRLAEDPAPHIRTYLDTCGIMMRVILSLVPALIWGTYIFGSRVLLLTFICMAFCMFFEWICRKALKRSFSLSDMSAAVTGMILAFTLPAGLPMWMAIVGCFIAIIPAKQLFGGLGHNFANPAVTASLALSVSFSLKMNTWPISSKVSQAILNCTTQDAVTGPTPLLMLKLGKTPLPTAAEMFLGKTSGGLGTVSALCILIGGLILLFTGVIRINIPAAYLVSMAIYAVVIGQSPAVHIFGGAAMFAAFYMATDPVTSPVTTKGQLIYGVGCGIITMLIQTRSVFPDGALFAVLVMNLLTPYIDRLTLPQAKGKRVNKNAK